MKFSESWLRSFVNPPLDTRELADALTFSGIEVEAIEAVAASFDRVVVGAVRSVDRHPDAERLSVCQVDVGTALLTVVCGAPNVRAGMKAATAMVGAKLPGLEIKAARVRGLESHGMLCSAKELGLSAEADGLMELPVDAEIGASVREVLELDDHVLTTKPTPNRGDVLSILGMAREVAAITGTVATVLPRSPVSVSVDDTLQITLEAPQACPRYCGRIIREPDAKAPTPRWMASRLERSGIRSISAVVDVTNYVMLETGQPLHAFDLAKICGGVHVRFARKGETLELLNGAAPTLGPDYLVIADDEKALALAGIMGGSATAVSDATCDLFLESAYFTPEVIAGRARALGLGSDSSFRFERGVDFEQTQRALDRATELIIEICGGQAGPVSAASGVVPLRKPVQLRLDRAEHVLGVKLGVQEAGEILRRLGLTFEQRERTFTVTPPSYRFDITLEEDLIEELARIHGYDKIPIAAPVTTAAMTPAAESTRPRAALRSAVAQRDYQEVVTYSFIDSRWEADLCGNPRPVALANPIASQMGVMRSSLIPGLVDTIAFNLRHKQTRVRVFEIGRCFRQAGEEYVQPVQVGGAAYGEAYPEQWNTAARRVDFYDVKGDLEALFSPRSLRCQPAEHPALHPGKSARLIVDQLEVGWLGELHPRWQHKFDLPLPPVLFEVDYDGLAARGLPAYHEIPKFPPVRRDVAALFDENVPFQAVLDALKLEAPSIVAAVNLFDVYRGKDLENGKKSLAFRVLFQDTRKTLTDVEVESAVSKLRQILRQRFDATLR